MTTAPEPAPPTFDNLARVRTLWNRAEEQRDDENAPYLDTVEALSYHVPDLLAEVDRLRAELAEARSDYQSAIDAGADVVRDLERARAENTALAGKIREFLDGERRIARRLDKAEDQNEKMRLLGLCEARKTLRESLGDKAPTRRSCGAKAQFCADDLLYTIGCGKDHGHRDPHYSFTAERGWVDGGIPFRAALGETGGTKNG